MPTLNPRITFTVTEETMKAIDEYRFSHRLRNQTQTIRRMMRWSTAKMLDRYAHPNEADVLEAADTMKRE